MVCQTYESNIEFSLTRQRPIEVSFLTTEALKENSLPNRKMMLLTLPGFLASFIHLFSYEALFEKWRRDISDKNSSHRREKKKTLYKGRGVREKEIPWNYLSDKRSAVKIASPAFNQS
ncbi:hypothetical protein CEXT_759341 [Caerostris extrusa]|uniref:Uncharacterized protein n=1 Tax=Caerostris extrusa TaxID=172846 RepID=A0AAV4VJC0_CAEEX|nr:hypothetical protein CEXT_759341 [Caerostris extrusa]